MVETDGANRELPEIVVVGCAGSFDHIFLLPHLPDPAHRKVRVTSSPAVLDTALWGGCAFNIAVGIAQFGAQVGIVNPIGTDFAQRGYLAYLKSKGVRTEGLFALANRLSNHSVMIQGPGASRYVLSYGFNPEELAVLDPGPKASAQAATARMLVLSPVAAPFMVELAQTARNRNHAVILVGVTAEADRSLLRQLIELSTYVVGTDDELNGVAAVLELNAAEDLRRRGVDALFLTQGASGSLVVTGDRLEKVPPLDVSAVDPTGAGDAFAAGVAAALLWGATPVAAARVGTVLASFAVEAVGAQTSLPTRPKAGARYLESYGEELPGPLAVMGC